MRVQEDPASLDNSCEYFINVDAVSQHHLQYSPERNRTIPPGEDVSANIRTDVCSSVRHGPNAGGINDPADADCAVSRGGKDERKNTHLEEPEVQEAKGKTRTQPRRQNLKAR